MALRTLTGRLTARHSLPVEAATVLALYAIYETTRGVVAGHRAAAVAHAHDVASLERTLGIFGEAHVQDAARAVPGLVGTLGALYLTLHLAATGAYLLWLHRRRPDAFPVVRTALLVASALALVGYLAFPTAPPRLAALGIADTISQGHVDLDHGVVSALYNPYAAMPSVHIAYATVVGASLVWHGRRRALRVLGGVYPLLQLVVIVATGNHFFADAAAGATVATFALGAAVYLLRAGVDAVPSGVRLAAPAKA